MEIIHKEILFMSIAAGLEEFLNSQFITYEPVFHHPSDTAFNTAISAHVSSAEVAKAVILKNETLDTTLMVVVPANKRVSISTLDKLTDCHFQLMDEDKACGLFYGCENGAIPGCGDAFGIDMIVDDSLLEADHVYLEAGDHKTLLKLDHDNYAQMVLCAPHAKLSAAAVKGYQNPTLHHA